jgi:hypothetical protein
MLWISKKGALEIPDLNGAPPRADSVTLERRSMRCIAIVA